MRNWFARHPFVMFLFVLLISRVAGIGGIQAVRLIQPELTIQDIGWLLQLIYAGAAIALIVWAGVTRECGLVKPAHGKEWLVWLPVLAMPAFIWLQVEAEPVGGSKLVVLLLSAVFVAVNEETLFRGLLLRGFERFGVGTMIFVPAVLFGLAHSTNLFVGSDTTFTLLQTLWTFLGGIALAAMRIRNGSIYPVIVFHFLLDASEYITLGEVGIHMDAFPLNTLLMFVVLSLAFAIYALWLVFPIARKKRPAASVEALQTA
jgi:uncharacterized protein